jgi:hypothetical protein
MTLKKILSALTLLRFNEHDYKHRKGCFKKSDECRFSYPRQIREEFGLQIDFDSEPTTWFTSLGNNKKLFLPCIFNDDQKTHGRSFSEHK